MVGVFGSASQWAKYWRLSCRIYKKQKTMALGVYPTVSLKDARVKRDEAKKLLAERSDPGKVKADKKREEDNHFNGEGLQQNYVVTESN